MAYDTIAGGSESDSSEKSTSSSRIARRRFVQAAGAAGVVGLAGCTGGGGDGGGNGSDGASTGGSGDGIELSYWTLFTGGDGAVMKAIIDKFNEEQPVGDNVTINRQRTPWDEHYNKLFTSMTGGNAPDMAISHASYLRRFQDTLTDITGNLSSEAKNNYVESIWSSCTLDESQYAVPMDSHPIGLYYNTDLLEEAGVEPPFDNFSQFEEACNAIKENTDAMPFSPDPYWGGGGGFRQWFMGLKQQEGSMFNDDFSEATFGGDGPGLQALEYLTSISGERSWDQPDTSADRVTQAFQNGDIAMTVNGTWYVTVMREVDFGWGFQKPRIIPQASQLKSTADSHTIVIPRNSDASDERIQAAVDAAEWITQENPSWGSEAGHLPAYNPILESDQLRESDLWEKTLKKFMEMAQNDQLAYWPQLPNSDLYASSNWTWVTDAYGQNVSPQQALKQGVKTWNSTLG